MNKVLGLLEGILGLIIIITVIVSMIVLCPTQTAIIVACGLLILVIDAIKQNGSKNIL